MNKITRTSMNWTIPATFVLCAGMALVQGSAHAAGNSDSAGFLTSSDDSLTLVSDLLSVQLRDAEREEGETLGVFSDALFDADNRLVGVVVDVGGHAGTAEKKVGIPWRHIQRVDREEGSAYTDLKREEIRMAPAFRTAELQQRIDERQNENLESAGRSGDEED